MNKFETILNSLPEKPARSRLDPYQDLICELLSRGWTYREISRILLEKCGVHICISTIHHFVHTRCRSKRKPSHPKNFKKTAMIPIVRNEGEKITRSGREILVNDEVYQRIATLKQRPIVSRDPSEQFHYDPEEPLHLPHKK